MSSSGHTGSAAHFPGAVRSLDRLSAPLARILPSRDRWIVVIQDGARTTAWATGHCQTAATAVMTALSIEPMLTASPDVWAAHELLTLGELRPALSAAGITIGPPAGQDR